MKKYYIAVDFDGTLVENKFPNIGQAKVKVVRKLKKRIYKLARAGWEPVLILWTCRCDHGDDENYLSDAIQWCRDNLPFEFLYFNENPDVDFGRPDLEKKIFAHEYWDDRAYNPIK